MFWIITKERRPGDIAVTSTYLSTIKKGIECAGYTCEIWEKNSKIDREDYLIFDECKIAVPYILRGYKNIIIWIQGVVPEEAVMKGYGKYRYVIHSALEYITLRKAKLIFMCSQAMEDHYQNKYKLSLLNKTLIMPCFNEVDININDFKKPNKYIDNSFLYVGTLNVWQCFEETVQIYKMIEEKIHGKSCLYIYTPDQNEAYKIIQRYQVKNYRISYLPANKLGEKIGSFKYGFVLRKNNIVNRVATPTKLSNYIAHGVIPIYSECLQSFHEYKEKSKGYAIPCNIDNTNLGVKNILHSMQKNISPIDVKRWCSETFKSYYSQNKYIVEISRLIEKM